MELHILFRSGRKAPSSSCVSIVKICLVSFVLISLLVGKSESRPQEDDHQHGAEESHAAESPSDYGESDYDDKDVQFDQSPPNLLILLADPKNGSTVPLANQPNTEVVLDSSYEKVHLFCSAYYPIKWVYTGDGFPFLNVDYTRFVEDFYDPTSYAFSALLELDGLKESQSGNYSCQKWDSSNFSSSFHVYIPGRKTFLAEENITITLDSKSIEIKIPCAVSDPSVNVSLLKAKDASGKDWVPMSPSLYTFSPKWGFNVTRSASAGNISESYRCSADNGKELQVNVEYTVPPIVEKKEPRACCDKAYLRSLGDDRTSCRGYISQSCQTPNFLNPVGSPCKDWKLAEFFKSPVELCRKEIAPSNASMGAGYFTQPDDKDLIRLFMYCQADPDEFTQGFKMALEWKNGSMLFVDDERHLVPGLSDFPSGYEVHAEITDLLNPDAPLDPLTLHCYIPLKFSFKWIKISRVIPTADLVSFASTWYNVTTTTTRPPPTPSTRSPGIRKNDGLYNSPTWRPSSSRPVLSTNDLGNGRHDAEEMIAGSSSSRTETWGAMIISILIAIKLCIPLGNEA